jgi:hypothetical protein
MIKKIFGSKSEKPVNRVAVNFYVPDDDAGARASKALSQVKIPLIPQLKTLQAARQVGDSVLVRLRKEINIIGKIGSSKADVRRLDQQILDQLRKDKEHLAEVIDGTIQPMNGVLVEMSTDVAQLRREMLIITSRIEGYERMMQEVFDKVPQSSIKDCTRIPWVGTLKEAAIHVCERYKVDEASVVKNYRSLRDASNDFFSFHIFVYEPTATADSFYENVKKARGYLR